MTLYGGARSLDNVAKLTDNSGASVNTSIAATVGCERIPFFVNLSAIGAADVLTFTPGYKFKVLAMDFRVHQPATTPGKAATLSPKIGSTAITGGVVALTSANATPAAAQVAGSAVTAANLGTATDTITVTGSSVTAFVEGSGWILLRIQNMDTADALATLLSKVNSIITAAKR